MTDEAYKQQLIEAADEAIRAAVDEFGQDAEAVAETVAQTLREIGGTQANVDDTTATQTD